MNENCKLAAVGDNCIDFYDQTGDAYPGGNPVNVAVYTVRLGGTASYTGTALSHVSIVDGDRVFGDYEEGVMASFRLTDEDIDFLCAHDLVVSGLWGMIAPDLPRLKARGAKVAFDFADKPEDPVVEQALPFVDYAFFSNDADGDAALEDFLRGITARGPKVAVVTRGEKGSLAYDGERFYRGDIVPCRVVDTMGAGDSFIAGFLYGLMRGQDIPACMALGAQNSSVTLGYAGAW